MGVKAMQQWSGIKVNSGMGLPQCPRSRKCLFEDMSHSVSSHNFFPHCCRVTAKVSGQLHKKVLPILGKVLPIINYAKFKVIFAKANTMLKIFFCHFSVTFGKIMSNFSHQFLLHLHFFFGYS
jgi:hypothetical protein